MTKADKNRMGRRCPNGVAAWLAIAATLLALAAALAGVASAGTAAPSARALLVPLRIATPRLDPTLARARGSVRAVITLRARPVLAAAERGPTRAQIDGRLRSADRRAI